MIFHATTEGTIIAHVSLYIISPVLVGITHFGSALAVALSRSAFKALESKKGGGMFGFPALETSNRCVRAILTLHLQILESSHSSHHRHCSQTTCTDESISPKIIYWTKTKNIKQKDHKPHLGLRSTLDIIPPTLVSLVPSQLTGIHHLFLSIFIICSPFTAFELPALTLIPSLYCNPALFLIWQFVS